MKNKHTAGEWQQDNRKPEYSHVIGVMNDENKINPICYLHIHSYGNKEEDEANAKLIAAAPALLDTCQSALSSLKDMREDATITGIIMVLEMAINKATS